MSVQTEVQERGHRTALEPTAGRSRPRRLRRSGTLRDMVRETRVSVDRMVMPHFVLPLEKADKPIPSLPGIGQLGQQDLLRCVERDRELGIPAVLLFGIPAEGSKDLTGTAAADAAGAVPTAVRALKQRFGSDLLVITDVCLCGYTIHGHCGIVGQGKVLNDATLLQLASVAVSHAEAGADFVAPSDMMDGRVGAIRDALDKAALSDTGILSYAVKYASAYYGPFREAAETAGEFGHRRAYQMDPGNVREAVREACLDEAEGADMLMVKPALPYLDVISAVRGCSCLPVAAYSVSGEYAAVKAAAERGWLSEPDVVRENLLAMARAGADVIITYHARDVAREGWL